MNYKWFRKHKIDSGTILIDNDDIYEYSKDVVLYPFGKLII